MHLDRKIEAEEEKLARDEQKFEAEQAAAKKLATGSNKKTKKKLSNAEALKYASSIVSEPAVDDKNNRTQKTAAATAPLKFQPGATVRTSSGTQGVLIDQTKKGVWQVQFGSIKMSMKEKDLKLVASEGSAASAETSFKPDISIELADDASNGIYERPVFELRLLGMRADEAVKALERQIDLCVLHNFPHFSVIHGKGDGVLMQAVSDYLSHCPVVAEFSKAPAEDGGAGKTYVALK